MSKYDDSGHRYVTVPWSAIEKPNLITDLGLITDPGADKLLFWDDSESAFAWTTMVTGGPGTLTADFGLTGGGDMSTNIGIGIDDAVAHDWTGAHSFNAGLTIQDSGNTDKVVFTHDGTDLSVAATNTTNVNLTGAALKIDTNAADSPGTPTMELTGSRPVFVLNEDDAAADNGRWYIHAQTEGFDMVAINDANDTSSTFFAVERTGTTVDSIDLTATTLNLVGTTRVTAGNVFRVQDSGDTDYIEMSHDGTDFNLDFTNTTDLNLNDGIQLKLWDAANTDSINLLVGSDTFTIGNTGVNYIDIPSLGQGIRVRDGNWLRLYDSADTDYVQFSHDGTDFNIAATNTDNLVFTGTNVYVFEGNTSAIEGASPKYSIRETDQAANEKNWLMVSSASTFSFATATDASPNAIANNAISILRTGTTVDEVQIDATTLDVNGQAYVSGTMTLNNSGAGLTTAAATINANAPYVRIREADQAADTKDWLFGVSSATLHLCPILDADLTPNTTEGIHITRDSSATVTEIQLDADTVDINGGVDISGDITAAGTYVSSRANSHILLRATGAVDSLDTFYIDKSADLSRFMHYDNSLATFYTWGSFDFVSSKLTWTAPTEIELNATNLDFNGAGDISGALDVGSSTGGQVLALRPGSADHVYLAWYADTAAPTTRSAWMGFGGVGTDVLTIANEFGTDIRLEDNTAIRGGSTFYVYDSTNTDSIAISNDGTDAFLTGTTTRYLRFSGYTTGVQVDGGQDFSVADSTGSDKGTFQHDGTDFNLTLTGTTDWNITGATQTYIFDRPVRTAGYTVAGLPTGTTGDRAYVTDANATTFASTVAGGGSNVVPVFFDGTNWIIG